MMKGLRFVISLVVILCMAVSLGISSSWFSNTAEAVTVKTFYVATNGSDSYTDAQNDINHPFAKITRARDAAKAWRDANGMTGDIAIDIRGGTYTLDSTIAFDQTDSGIAPYNIVYQAHTGEKSVIDGSRSFKGSDLGGWQSYSGNIKKIYVGNLLSGLDPNFAFRQIFVTNTDGSIWRATRAHTEKSVKGHLGPLGEVWYGNYQGMYINGNTQVNNSGTQLVNLSNKGDVEAVGVKEWQNGYFPLQDIVSNGSNSVLLFDEQYFKPYKQLDVPGSFSGSESAVLYQSIPLYIENAVELVDNPGEWYYDKNTKYLYYYPITDVQDLSTAYFYIPVLEKLMQVKGTMANKIHNIQFIGLDFVGTGYTRPNTKGFFGWQGLDMMEYVPSTTVTLASPGKTTVNCTLQNTGTGYVASTYTTGWTSATGSVDITLTGDVGQAAFDDFVYGDPNTSANDVTVNFNDLADKTVLGTYMNIIWGTSDWVIGSDAAGDYGFAASGKVAFMKQKNIYPPSQTLKIITLQQAGKVLKSVRIGHNPNTQVTMPAAVELDAANSITFTDNVFERLGDIGLAMYNGVGGNGADNVLIKGNVFRDISGSAIRVGLPDHGIIDKTDEEVCKNVTIKDNLINRIGQDYWGSEAILACYADTLKVSYNDISNIPWVAIDIGTSSSDIGFTDMPTTSQNNHIVYNKIYDCFRNLRDGGPIYVFGNQGTPSSYSEVGNNYISQDHGGGRVIYAEEGSAYYTVHDNVVDATNPDRPPNWFYINSLGPASTKIHDLTVQNNYFTGTLSDGITPDDVYAYYHTWDPYGRWSSSWDPNMVANIPYSNNLVVSDANWPQYPGAQSTVNNAGLEEPYRTNLLPYKLKDPEGVNLLINPGLEPEREDVGMDYAFDSFGLSPSIPGWGMANYTFNTNDPNCYTLRPVLTTSLINYDTGASTVSCIKRSSNPLIGPGQDITNILSNYGMGNYKWSARARLASGTDSAKAFIVVKNTAGQEFSFDGGSWTNINSTSWTQLSVSQNITWTGTLKSAKFFVGTNVSTADLYVDDCSLKVANIPFVTSKTLTTLRNNDTVSVGMKITVGTNPITATALGRIFVTGNIGTHTVRIAKVSDGQTIGSASIPMAGGTASQFKYAYLATPVTLAANTSYYITSDEVTGGDQWYECDTTVTTTSAAVVNDAAYGYSGTPWTWYLGSVGSNHSFVPVDFKYREVGAATPTPTPAPTPTPTPGGSVKLTVSSASASSTYNGTWVASRAIDGLITPPDSTTWGASSAAQPQWLKLDLGAVKTVNKTNIAWYNPTVSIYTYNIQVSTDDITYTTVVSSKNSTSSTWLADTFANTSARYVKINITASTYDWDSITEAEVYGQ